MPDIPVRNVQVIWSPDSPGLSPVAIVGAGYPDDGRYDSSWGSCNDYFANATDAERINLLMRQFVHLTAIEGIPAQIVHDTFMDIPEYRKALADFGSIDPRTV